MRTFNLTNNEYEAARALVVSCLDNMGGDRPIDLDNDPLTWIDLSDLIRKGWTQHAGAGTLGALLDKGFIVDTGEGLAVSTEGYRWLDTVW